MKVRPPVAVLLSRFPRVTETFILREVNELERQGWPVLLVPLIRESPEVIHPEARPWLEQPGRALFTPWLSPAIVASHLRALRRRPGVYLATLARLVAGTLRSPAFLVKSLVLFPKAVHLAERLRAAGVPHVHAHFATHPATVAWIVERLTGIPYSLTVHAHDIFVDRALLGPKLRRARFVRAISEYNRRYLADRHPGAADRLEVIHVGVDPTIYEVPPTSGSGRRRLHGGARGTGGGVPLSPRGERGNEGERGDPAEVPPTSGASREESRETSPWRVLTVAALRPYKGLEVLLQAAAILTSPEVPPTSGRGERGIEGERGDLATQAVFEVVGEGPLRGVLEAAIARRGLGGVVRLAGAVPQEEVARRLAAADLFVLPSVVAPDGQMEGIPVALMEALASELPVVASDLSGIPELVEDGVTGLLVPPGDAAALAGAVARLIADPELGRRLGRAGRERVESDFALRTTVAELGARLGREIGPPEGGAAVAAALAGAGLGATNAGIRRWIETGDSRVAEVTVAAGPGEGGEDVPREVVVKVHRDRSGQSAPPAARARRELALLARLAAREPDDGRLGVPRPLCATPAPVAGEGAAVVMERARGERLDRVIRARRFRPGGRRDALTSAFRRAGEWLLWFQRAAGGDEGPAVHGDFWPGNLFLAPDRIEGIDFEGAEVAGGRDPWDDAAYFLLHAELYFAPFTGRRAAPLAPRFRRLEGAFLEGFAPAAPLSSADDPLRSARRRVARSLLARGGWPRRQRALLSRHARRGSRGADR